MAPGNGDRAMNKPIKVSVSGCQIHSFNSFFLAHPDFNYLISEIDKYTY